MTRIDALKALAAKVDAGNDRDFLNAGLAFEEIDQAIDAVRAYHGSLDAAKALHHAFLPGWGYAFDSSAGAVVVKDLDADGSFIIAANGDNPARAWLLAILRALIAQEEAVHPLQALQDAGQAWDAG